MLGQALELVREWVHGMEKAAVVGQSVDSGADLGAGVKWGSLHAAGHSVVKCPAGHVCQL